MMILNLLFFCKTFRFYNNLFAMKYYSKIMFNKLLQLEIESFSIFYNETKKFYVYLNNLLNRNKNVSLNSYGLVINPTLLPIEHIKVQELTFLPEYFLITAIFCLTLFGLKAVLFYLPFNIKKSQVTEFSFVDLKNNLL